MSNRFPLDVAIGLFVGGFASFILGHSAVYALRRYVKKCFVVAAGTKKFSRQIVSRSHVT